MNELIVKLQKYLSEKRGKDNITIENFEKLNLGFEAVKYSFIELSSVDKITIANKFVLRMLPDIDEAYGAKNEFIVMERLYKEGFPVPKVILFEEDESILGEPFLMLEFIENKKLSTYIVNAPSDLQEYWMKKFAEVLVKLHQVDWKKIITDKAPKDLENPFFSFDEYITNYVTDWKKYGYTFYKTTLDWLKKERENYPAERIGFNHKDFGFHNVIVKEDESLIVVDWSWSNVSDIRFDIANTKCTFSMTGQENLGKLFLEYYEEISGEPIGDMTFYEVLSALQLLFVCILLIEKLEKESEGYKENLKTYRFWMENMYEFLVKRTKIRIPEIEEIHERMMN